MNILSKSINRHVLINPIYLPINHITFTVKIVYFANRKTNQGFSDVRFDNLLRVLLHKLNIKCC